jgi:hypothetical protein
MRGIFSIVGLLITLAIIGLLVKKQLGTQVAVPATPGMPAVSANAPPQVRSQQTQQQVKQAVEGALQQPRAMPEEK